MLIIKCRSVTEDILREGKVKEGDYLERHYIIFNTYSLNNFNTGLCLRIIHFTL